MAEARVCGNSEQARGLKSIMNQTMQHIETCISSMERAANTIHGAWADDGAGEVDEILTAIRSALNDAKDAMPSVGSALDVYADFLDEQ